MTLAEAAHLLIVEAEAARRVQPSFHSCHEGLAVIWEEFDELKAEVFKKPESRTAAAIRIEAVQLGAMALRFIIELT